MRLASARGLGSLRARGMTTKSQEPQIAASIVNGTRRSLIEDGTWERIEPDVLARAPILSRWLRDAERAEWVSLEGYLLFMQALLDVLGRDALIELGSTRLRADIDVGALAPLLRGWIREFARDASELLRVAPHAWQAITKNAGRMVLADSGRGHIRFRVEGAPASLLALSGWHFLLSGFGAELLRRSGRHGSFSVGPAGDGSSLVLEGRWSDDAS